MNATRGGWAATRERSFGCLPGRAALLVGTVRKTGPDQAMSAALAPWRKARAVHDPAKTLLDVAPAVALGRGCLADAGLLRAEPALVGPLPSAS